MEHLVRLKSWTFVLMDLADVVLFGYFSTVMILERNVEGNIHTCTMIPFYHLGHLFLK